MPTLQEALLATGLATHAPLPHTERRLNSGRASHMGRWADPGAYDGRPVNLDKYADESISLGPAKPRVRRPADPAKDPAIVKLTRERMTRTVTDLGLTEDQVLFLAQRGAEPMEGICPSCRLTVPSGFDTCPDC